MRRDLLFHRRTPGGIDKHQRNRGDRRRLASAQRLHTFTIYPCTLTAMRAAQPPAQYIIDPPCHRLAMFGQRDQHAEGRTAGGEIVGAVDRIDDPAQSITQPIKHRGVGRGCFFTDNRGIGQQPRQRLAQKRLRVGVGDSDHVIDGFVRDLSGGQMLVPRQDCGLRDARHQRADFGVKSFGHGGLR